MLTLPESRSVDRFFCFDGAGETLGEISGRAHFFRRQSRNCAVKYKQRQPNCAETSPRCKIELLPDPGEIFFRKSFLFQLGGPKECGRAGGCAAAVLRAWRPDLGLGERTQQQTSDRAKTARSRESSSSNFATWSQPRSSSAPGFHHDFAIFPPWFCRQWFS